MKQKLPRGIGTVGLVFVLFFSTSGGPYTTETLIHSVGPGLGLLILALVPLVWSVPEALIVGELASMLPEEGGYYRWVQRAFGAFWAFQNGWLTWMYSLVDMAIYPVLFNQYLGFFVPSLGRTTRWIVALLVIWSATAINLRGARRVGRVSVVAGAFIILGFLALAVAALPHMTHTPWRPFAAPGRTGVNGLAVGLSIALWNYIGWDNASTAQGEVRDASRTYPLALSLEFASLVALRRREPDLRGAFRIPLGTRPVTILAALPMLVLVIVIYLSFRDGEYGIPALGGAIVAIVLGPILYYLGARTLKRRAEKGEPRRASREERAEKSEPKTAIE